MRTIPRTIKFSFNIERLQIKHNHFPLCVTRNFIPSGHRCLNFLIQFKGISVYRKEQIAMNRRQQLFELKFNKMVLCLLFLKTPSESILDHTKQCIIPGNSTFYCVSSWNRKRYYLAYCVSNSDDFLMYIGLKKRWHSPDLPISFLL